VKPEWTVKPRTILICVLLVVATAVAYEPLSGNGFITFDDNSYITQNKRVRAGLSWDGVAWAFTTRETANWHPLTWLSHMLDAELYGLEPAGHHRTNWQLHVASTLVLFLVFRRMTAAFWCSAFVAAIFALHPLHVESVAWAAERKDVLSALFWMLTLAAYVHYTDRPSTRRYSLVVLGLAMGLLAKPMLVTLPFVLLLLDYWPLGRLLRDGEGATSLRRVVLEKLPLFALIGISSAVTYVVQQRGGAVEEAALGLRLANAVTSYVGYVVKTLWPMSMAVMYPFPAHGVPLWKVLGATFILAAVTAGVIRFGGRWRYLPVGWFWYLGTLVPVIGLVRVGYQGSADRYTYIPSIGLSILIAWGAADLAVRLKARPAWVAVPACLVLVALTWATWAQVGHWRDTVTLYLHAIRVTEDNYVVYTNLGVAHLKSNNHNRAIHYLEKSVRARPDFDHGHYNLAVALQRTGRIDEAMEHFRLTLEARPDYANAHFALGMLLQREGKPAEAIEHLRSALDAMPDNVRLKHRLATALHDVGRLDEAIKRYREVLKADPENFAAHGNLARALTAQGRLDEASYHRAESRRLQSR
jgi:Flp pilus assembly protein TadD